VIACGGREEGEIAKAGPAETFTMLAPSDALTPVMLTK
jgi:hypothetical protein